VTIERNDRIIAERSNVQDKKTDPYVFNIDNFKKSKEEVRKQAKF